MGKVGDLGMFRGGEELSSPKKKKWQKVEQWHRVSISPGSRPTDAVRSCNKAVVGGL